jgi:acyl-CoA thioesterase
MHLLDESLDLTPLDGNTFSGYGHAGYWNAFGPFGGWIAAVLLQSVLKHSQAKGDPINLQVQFIGAIAQAPFQVRVRCVKQGRSTAFWHAELVQAKANHASENANLRASSGSDQADSMTVCAFAAITLSDWRETFSLTDVRMPDVPAPADTPIAPSRGNDAPQFISRFEYRYVSGRILEQNPTMDSRMWLRDAQARPLDAIALTCYADAPFPSVWLRMKDRVMITTVTFNVSFRVPQASLVGAGEGYVLLDSACDTAKHGFYDQHTNLWSQKGELIAQTQQLAWCSDKLIKRS